jgi:SAM-dependent methyltransferase
MMISVKARHRVHDDLRLRSCKCHLTLAGRVARGAASLYSDGGSSEWGVSLGGRNRHLRNEAAHFAQTTLASKTASPPTKVSTDSALRSSDSGTAAFRGAKLPANEVPVLRVVCMQADKEVISQWSESAPYWEKHREIIREMFAPITQALIADAEIASRRAVLDLATGPGEPALSIGELVGPEGKVVGIDAVPEMVEAARREAHRRGFRNATFEVAFADDLPFPANTFDAVVSRFGVMFFPSPIGSLREMLRVLKPGGRIAMAVWHFAERNPFHYIVSQVVERYVHSPPPVPDSPDAFRFADSGHLLGILSRAGAAATSERVLRFSIRAPIPVEKFWTLRSEMSDKLRAKLAGLSKEQMAELKREVIEALRAFSADGGMSFPAEVLIVSGGKEPS